MAYGLRDMEHDFAYINFLNRTRNGLSIMRWIIGLAYMAIYISFIAWYVNFYEYLNVFVRIYSMYKNMFISLYINHSHTNIRLRQYTFLFLYTLTETSGILMSLFHYYIILIVILSIY